MATPGTLGGYKADIYSAFGPSTVRNQPISDDLRRVLDFAASQAGVDRVKIISGGQPKKGTSSRRVGSVRHDLGAAADLQLVKDGRVLDFTNAADRAVFESFVSAAANAGATGIGAGKGYMGPNTIHVGFGNKSVWGSGGKAGNAPGWLRDAVYAGWNGSIAAAQASPAADVSPLGSATMKKGRATGSRVEALQETLAALDLYDGPINGKFDAATEQAVRDYQKRVGLKADGIVGPRTLSYMAPTYEEISQQNAPDPALDEFGVPRAVGRGTPYNPAVSPPRANPRGPAPYTQDGTIPTPRTNPMGGILDWNGTAAAPVPRMSGVAPRAGGPVPRMRPDVRGLLGSVASQSTPNADASVRMRMIDAAPRERTNFPVVGMDPNSFGDFGGDFTSTPKSAPGPRDVMSHDAARAAFADTMGEHRLREMQLAGISQMNAEEALDDRTAYAEAAAMQAELNRERTRRELASALIGTDLDNLPANAGTGGGVYGPSQTAIQNAIGNEMAGAYSGWGRQPAVNAAPRAAAASGKFLGGISDFADISKAITAPASQKFGPRSTQSGLTTPISRAPATYSVNGRDYDWVSPVSNYTEKKSTPGLDAVASMRDPWTSGSLSGGKATRGQTFGPPQPGTMASLAPRSQKFGASSTQAGVGAPRVTYARKAPAAQSVPKDFTPTPEMGAAAGIPTDMTALSVWGSSPAAMAQFGPQPPQQVVQPLGPAVNVAPRRVAAASASPVPTPGFSYGSLIGGPNTGLATYGVRGSDGVVRGITSSGGRYSVSTDNRGRRVTTVTTSNGKTRTYRDTMKGMRGASSRHFGGDSGNGAGSRTSRTSSGSSSRSSSTKSGADGRHPGRD